MRPLALLLAVGAFGLGRSLGSGADAASQATTAAVVVPVSVREGDRTVAGLTAADFELADNGVPQTIAEARADTAPLDLTLVLDVGPHAANLIDEARAAAGQTSAALRADDRVRIVSFSSRIRRLVAFEDDRSAVAPALSRLAPGGGTSVFDALAVAFAGASRPDRRAVIALFTAGPDTHSLLPGDAIPALADRSDAALFVIVPHSVLPFERSATATGGRVLTVQPGGIAQGFARAIEEVRGRYVLRYTPAGVARGGWHEIAVRVTRPGAFDVRTRRGYFASE